MFVKKWRYEKLKNKNEDLKKINDSLVRDLVAIKKKTAPYSVARKEEELTKKGFSNVEKMEIISKLAKKEFNERLYTVVELEKEFPNISKKLFLDFINMETDLYAHSGERYILIRKIPFDFYR